LEEPFEGVEDLDLVAAVEPCQLARPDVVGRVAQADLPVAERRTLGILGGRLVELAWRSGGLAGRGGLHRGRGGRERGGIQVALDRRRRRAGRDRGRGCCLRGTGRRLLAL